MKSRFFRALVVCAALFPAATYVVFAAISLSTTTAVTQNFDDIGTTATAPLPADFRADRLGTVRTVGTYAAAGLATTQTGGPNLSTSASNGIWNFGSGTTNTGAERAVGFLSSGTTPLGTQSGNLYAQYTNNTGTALTGLTISYDVEKYRNGTNSAGFRIQLFYSADGANWTDAGGNFLTTFASDSNSNGFSPAPGVSTSITNKPLPVTIPTGSNFYLAWNYSVASGTTTTNAQALAIDNISILGVAAGNSTSPTGTMTASPNTVSAGDLITLTVNVTPGTNPPSTGLAVTGDLSAIGGSSSQVFQGNGNTFTFDATVTTNTTDGTKSLPITITDAESRSGATTASVTVATPATNSTSVIVISQLYGGGGNSGAPLQNDYVELYNRGTTTVDIGGWSLQYASNTGSGWDSQKLALGGTIAPGQYYLIALAAGNGTAASLPVPSISGPIPMSATAGKVALVDTFDGLVGACPLDDEDQRPHVMDFVGYGPSANCHEGATNAPAPSNTTALFRLGGGSIDTDRNGSDFVTGTPAPRSTAPVAGGGGGGGGGGGAVGLAVLSTDPARNRVSVPRDATIGVTFTEPVDVFGAWFDITCVSTGQHNSATFAGIGQFHYITPNDNFLAGESCTVTLFKDQISGTGVTTDTLSANYTWSFTVATGTAPPYPASVHLTMGNPSGAIADLGKANNYLMEKPEFALSYNKDLGRPNWVSWHLSDEWTGTLTRVDTFRPDPAVPPDWYRVQAFDFSGSGFDRGHMTPNADRDKETSIPINQATFLMSNMVAQSPDNNQGPWAKFENYLRSLLTADEIYIVSGPVGTHGTGSNGGVTTTLAGGHVTVPEYTWKVALVLPKGEDDLSRVSCATRSIAVIMPNIQGIRADPWESFLTNVDAVETLTGYDLFSNLPEPIQRCVEAGTNGDNPPLVKGDQTITFVAPAARTYGDPAFTMSATGGSSANPVTFTASGTCTSGGSNGATITIVSAGPCTITASQAGSELYNAAPDVAQTLTIAKATPAFSNLGAPIVEAGAVATLSGRLSLASLAPTGSVAITLNGVTHGAAINPDGTFAATFATASLAPATYTTGFSYAGDGNFNGVNGTGSLRVVDTTPPSISGVSATPAVLGPPNHKMVDIAVGYQASDIASAPVCSLSISSNEPTNGNGDGNTSPDWLLVDGHHVQVRSERAGGGSGRIYTITVTCADAFGNSSSRTTTVGVPK